MYVRAFYPHTNPACITNLIYKQNNNNSVFDKWVFICVELIVYLINSAKGHTFTHRHQVKDDPSVTLSPTDIRLKTNQVTLSHRDIRLKTNQVTLSPTDIRLKTNQVTLSPTDIRLKTNQVTLSPTYIR